MARYLRAFLVPLVVVLIGLGGASYALTAAEPDEVVEPSDPPAPDDGTTDDGTVDDGTDDGTVDDGTTDEGETDDGTVDDGTTDGGTVDDGSTDAGSVDDGTTDDGTTDDGSVDDGTNEAIDDTEADPCPEGFTGNHGQYVSSTPERPRRDAAHSDCGKPVKPDDTGDDEPADDDAGEADDTEDEPVGAAKTKPTKSHGRSKHKH